jgi:uncharacterized membrane protein
MDTFCAACGSSLPAESDGNFNNGVDNEYSKNDIQNNNFGNDNQMPRINPLAIVSLVTGILGLVLVCCCRCLTVPLSIAGIVTGIITLKGINDLSHKNDRIFAIIGIATSGVSLALMLIIFVLGALGFFDEFFSEFYDGFYNGYYDY